MNVAILGFGSQGQSAAEYWHKKGHHITICDQNTELDLPNYSAGKLGADYLKDLSSFDLIVRSPSIHPQDITAANDASILEKVTTNTNEFFATCPTKNIIGVTGTKGKGTTSTLITKMLEASGLRVHLGGNIGIPPLELLKNDIRPDDWVVLELANFQLIDIKHSPHIAICLMITSEHQDWHKSFEEYVQAKKQLFRWQKADDIAIYNAGDENSIKIAFTTGGQTIGYMHKSGAYVDDDYQFKIGDQVICPVTAMKLRGKHNWQNICAAITTTWQVTKNTEAIASVIKSFTGLEHRLEFVRELDGVQYFDDSFGTTPETAIVAIEAFSQPKVVVLGGSDKGADYTELANTVKNNDIRKILLIGNQSARIQTALEQLGFDNFAPGGDTMEEIVNNARSSAQDGDVVLLSTGCASFDMFKNYKDRGEQFKKSVLSLS